MLQYEKIDVSGGIDTNKTSLSKQCMLCYYWYFKHGGFRFEPHVFCGVLVGMKLLIG